LFTISFYHDCAADIVLVQLIKTAAETVQAAT